MEGTPMGKTLANMSNASIGAPPSAAARDSPLAIPMLLTLAALARRDGPLAVILLLTLATLALALDPELDALAAFAGG
jgi:hypothetical protein